MTPDDLEDLRHRLEARATEILHQTHLAVVDADTAQFNAEEVSDSTDLAKGDELKATRADMTDRDRTLLVAVRDALARIHDGGYGVCEDCGEDIPLERLRVVPWTTRCADDQQRLEELDNAANPTARPTM